MVKSHYIFVTNYEYLRVRNGPFHGLIIPKLSHPIHLHLHNGSRHKHTNHSICAKCPITLFLPIVYRDLGKERFEDATQYRHFRL